MSIIIYYFFFRYLAICHPLYSYTMSGLRRASKIIAVVWVLALAAAIPYAVFSEIHYVPHPNNTNQVCNSYFLHIYILEFSSGKPFSLGFSYFPVICWRFFGISLKNALLRRQEKRGKTARRGKQFSCTVARKLHLKVSFS